MTGLVLHALAKDALKGYLNVGTTAPTKAATPGERAREVAVYRQGLLDKKRTTSAPISLENMFASKASTTIEFPMVVRADEPMLFHCGLRGMFSTHPSTEERVERLMLMARGALGFHRVPLRELVGGEERSKEWNDVSRTAGPRAGAAPASRWCRHLPCNWCSACATRVW